MHVGRLYLGDVYCTIKYLAKALFIKHFSDNVHMRHTLYFHYFKEALTLIKSTLVAFVIKNYQYNIRSFDILKI